ncbi:MAG: PorV/PorQ family protein [Fidelibacterota bacterium]|nr:MAG: PorV/PorQ family protein [Candidatus Neomarinimicrobiota bacterium]
MKVNRGIMRSVVVLVSTLLTGSSLLGQVKLAQSGFQFLSIGADARATGMAEAMTTSDWGSGALFFNPAGMAQMPTAFDLAASRNQWIADITHNAFSMAINPANGVLGVFGISLFSVDYGEIEGTMYWESDAGYIDTEVFTPGAIAVGVGYARAISDRFSVGGHVKYVGQHLGESVVPVGDSLTAKKNLAFATAVDFGTLFKTGFRGLVFGMSIRNFSGEVKYERETFQLPLTFRMGLAANLFEFLGVQSGSQALHLRVDASHPRAFSEQMNVGIEYGFLNTVFLRGGYLVNYDERGGTFGVGVQLLGLHVDYAYTPFGIFDQVQQFTIRFAR